MPALKLASIAACLFREHDLHWSSQKVLLLHCSTHLLEILALRVYRDSFLIFVTTPPMILTQDLHLGRKGIYVFEEETI